MAPEETTNTRLLGLVRYDPVWHVLICTACKTCFRTSVSVHVRDYHKHLRTLRPAVLAYEASFLDGRPLITSPEKIRELQPPSDTPPIDKLPVHRDGILCLLCRDDPRPYICRAIGGIGHHLRHAHNYRSPVKAGGGWRARSAGAEAARSSVMQGPVACQSFFRKSAYVRYFPVALQHPAPRTGRGPVRARQGRPTSKPTSQPTSQPTYADYSMRSWLISRRRRPRSNTSGY
ncbi:hypothetical protein IMZ48_00980 [Candidatus Bathyarchaeota archaeon]|nr:hypothetical protein [Candidatus Bathyarchaeota archaeon]